MGYFCINLKNNQSDFLERKYLYVGSEKNIIAHTLWTSLLNSSPLLKQSKTAITGKTVGQQTNQERNRAIENKTA